MKIYGIFTHNGVKFRATEKIVNLHIEKLPEGFYLATSDNIQGLVAQGRTIIETLDLQIEIQKQSEQIGGRGNRLASRTAAAEEGSSADSVK